MICTISQAPLGTNTVYLTKRLFVPSFLSRECALTEALRSHLTEKSLFQSSQENHAMLESQARRLMMRGLN